MSEDALLNNTLQKKRNNFTIIPNALINDDSIGERAKAVYMYLASKPTNWSFKVGEIQSHFKQSITNPIKELEQSRWLCRVKKPIKGKGMGFRLIWYIAEKPFMVEQIEEMRAQREKEPLNEHIPTTPNFNDGRCATMVVANDDRKPTMMVETPVYNNTDCLSNTDIYPPYSPPKGGTDVQTGSSSANPPSDSPVLDLPPVVPLKGDGVSQDFDSWNQGQNLHDQPKESSKTNLDKFFPGSSGSKDDEQIPSMESLRISKDKESSQKQLSLRGESNTNTLGLTNEEFVNNKFEEMWQEYKPYVSPDGHSVNKGPKKVAKEKFARAVAKGSNPDSIIAGTKRYIQDCYNRKCLTKNVVTFLNQAQWEDYLETQNFSNPDPINIDSLAPFESFDEFRVFINPLAKPFYDKNPYLKAKLLEIKIAAQNDNNEKSLKIALELAKEIWEYKDTTQIKNSILDPNLWSLCRFEIEPSIQKGIIMLVGYFLRRLWLEEKRRLAENKS